MFGLFRSQITQAQGTTYLSNLGQSSSRSFPVASDKWIAQSFLTGTDSGGYMLNSVQLRMDAASGNPNDFDVSIDHVVADVGVGIIPASSLGSLSSSDPAAGGIFTYTTSHIALRPATLYFVVVTSATAMAQGAYNWSGLSSGAQSNNMWSIGPYSDFSTDGLNWDTGRNAGFQFAISATPIPEPSSLSLLGALALPAFLFLRRAKT
jgi:hypothetical protein